MKLLIMTKCQWIFAGIFLLSSTLVGQFEDYQPYRFPESLPTKYSFDKKAAYQFLLKKKYKGNYSTKVISRYAETMVYFKDNLFQSGGVYADLSPIESYLNELVELIAPPEQKGKLKVYVHRDPGYNAITIYDGSIFFNIGLLSVVQSEAALVTILAHEIGHAYHNDVEDDYFSSVKTYTKKKRNNNLSLRIDKAHNDKKQEKRADMFGYDLTCKAGYKLSDAKSNYLLFMDYEKYVENSNRRSRISNVYTSDDIKTEVKEQTIAELLATHPETFIRMKDLDAYIADNKVEGGVSFKLRTEAQFKEIQTFARYESLHLMLQNNNLEECIERSLFYHLFSPNDRTVLYFMLEGIRRQLFLGLSKPEDGLLNNKYSGFFDDSKSGICNKLQLVVRDSLLMNKIVASDFLGNSKPFENYLEAFIYFASKCNALSIKEAILTQALFYKSNSTKSDSLLSSYIDTPEVLYKDFAVALKNNNLVQPSMNKQVMLIDNIMFMEDHYYGYHNRQLVSDQKTPKYLNDVSGYLSKHYPEKQLIYIPHESRTRFNEILNLRFSMVSAFALYRSDNSLLTERSFFQLAPEYWYEFKNKNIRSIEYVNVEAFDDKTKVKSILNVINPFFYYFIFAHYSTAFLNGSSRFKYEVNFFSFDISKEKKIAYYGEEVEYKLTPAGLINGIYYGIEKTKDRE